MQKTQQSNKNYLGWILSCMGTAIGAGILFLPLQAGKGGLISFFLAALLALPMSYYSLKLMLKFQMTSLKPVSFTEALNQHISPGLARLVTFGYFITFITLLISYSTALTNDCFELTLKYVPSMEGLSKSIFSAALLAALGLALILGEKALLTLMKILTIPLIVLISIFSLLLIPHWDVVSAFQVPDLNDLLIGVFHTTPLICFSVLYYPTLSEMIFSTWTQFEKEGQTREHAKKDLKQVLFWGQFFLSSFLLFFITSCLFSLNDEKITMALQKNISIMAIMGQHFPKTFIEWGIPAIGVSAITSSFLGVFLGVKEGAITLIKDITKKTVISKKIEILLILLTSCILWSFTIQNISVSSILGLIATPFLSIVFFIVTGVLFMKKKSSDKADILTVIFGIFLIFSYFLGSFISST